MLKAYKKRLEALSDEFNQTREKSAWTMKTRRSNSSPLLVNNLKVTNRFAPLALNVDPLGPLSPTSRAGAADNHNHSEAAAHPVAVPTMGTSAACNKGSLFYLRAIPRTTNFEHIKEKIGNFGVPTETLSLPPTLSTQSRSIYMTLTLSVNEANKLASALKEKTDLGWFISLRPPRLRKAVRVSRCEMSRPWDEGPTGNDSRGLGTLPITSPQFLFKYNRDHIPVWPLPHLLSPPPIEPKIGPYPITLYNHSPLQMVRSPHPEPLHKHFLGVAVVPATLTTLRTPRVPISPTAPTQATVEIFGQQSCL